MAALVEIRVKKWWKSSVWVSFQTCFLLFSTTNIIFSYLCLILQQYFVCFIYHNVCLPSKCVFQNPCAELACTHAHTDTLSGAPFGISVRLNLERCWRLHLHKFSSVRKDCVLTCYVKERQIHVIYLSVERGCTITCMYSDCIYIHSCIHH